MNRFTLGLIQMIWQADQQSHLANLEARIAEAKQNGASLICLQELTCSSYFPAKPEASDEPEEIPNGRSCQLFSRLARKYEVYLVGSLYERAEANHLYNTAVLYDPQGRFSGTCRKQHIPWDIGYYERNYFEPGNSGYPVFELPFVRLAMPTCYDQWFPEAARIYALNGAELIVFPTAIGSEPTIEDFDTQPAWLKIIASHAIANNVYVAAVNRVGSEDGLEFFGSSFVSDPGGQIVAQASRDQEQVVLAELDPQVMETWRRLFPFFQRREPRTYQRICKD